MTDRRPTLVLVDDEVLVRRGLVLMLRRSFDVVGEASSAEDASRIIRETDPDLVLVDLHLGRGPNGFALTRWLKTERPEQHVLILSSRPQSLFAERAIETGALGFVMKSVELDTLGAAIRKALGGQLVLTRPLAEQFLDDGVERSVELETFDTAEQRILLEMARGATTANQIARRLERPESRVDRDIWALRAAHGFGSWTHLSVWVHYRLRPRLVELNALWPAASRGGARSTTSPPPNQSKAASASAISSADA